MVPVSSARKAVQDIGATPQSASNNNNNNNEEDAPASLQVMGSITKVMNQIKGKIDTMSVVPSLGGGNNSMTLVAASPSGGGGRYDPQIPRNLSEEEVMQNHRRMLGSKPGRSEGCNIYAMVLRQKLNPNRNLDSRKGGISTMDSLFIMTGSLRDVKGSSLSDNPDGNVFVEEVEGHRERAVAIFSSFSRSYLKKKVGEEKQVLDSALRLKPFSSVLKPYTGYWLSGKGNPAVRVGDVIKLNNITLSTSEWRPPKKNDVPFVEAEFSTFCNFMNIEGVLSPYSAQGIVEAMEREGIITRWFITPARRNGIHTKAMVEARNPNVNMPLKPNDMLFIRIRGSIKDSVNNLNDNLIMEEEEEEGGEEDEERARSGDGDENSVNNDDDGSEELTSYQQNQEGYGGGGASHLGSSSVGRVQQGEGEEGEDPYANGAIVTPLFTEREMANYNDYEKTTFYIEKTDPEDMKKKNRVLGFRLMCRVTQRESRSDPIIFGFVWVTAYTEVAEEFLAIGDVTAGTWFMSDYLKMLDFVLVCKVDEERTCKRTENDHDIHVNNFNRFVKPFDLLPYEKMWSENHKDIEKFYFMQPPDKLPYDVQQRYYGGYVDGGGVTGSPYEVAEVMGQDQAGETPYMTVSHPDDDEEGGGGGGVEGDSMAMESTQVYGGNDGGSHQDSEAGAVVAQYGGEGGDDNDEFEGEEEERAGATAVEDSYIELVGNTAMADVGGGGGGSGGGASGIVDRRRSPLFAYCADAQLVICDVYSFYMRVGIPVSAKMAVTLAKIWRHPQQLLATRRNTILLKTGVICLNDHNMPEETLNYEGGGRSKVHYRVVIDIENFDKSIEEIFASLVAPPPGSSSNAKQQQQKACEEGDKFVTYLFKCLSPGEYTLPIPKNAEAGNHLLAVYNQLLKAHGKAVPGQSGARRIALPTNTPWANAVKLLIDSKKKFNISSGGLVFLMIDPGTRYVCESQTINAMFNGVYRFGKRKIADSPLSLTSGASTSGTSDDSVQDPPAKCARIEAVATTDDNAPEESSITKGTKKNSVQQQQQTKRHPDSDDEVEEAEEEEAEEAASSQDEDQD